MDDATQKRSFHIALASSGVSDDQIEALLGSVYVGRDALARRFSFASRRRDRQCAYRGCRRARSRRWGKDHAPVDPTNHARSPAPLSESRLSAGSLARLRPRNNFIPISLSRSLRGREVDARGIRVRADGSRATETLPTIGRARSCSRRDSERGERDLLRRRPFALAVAVLRLDNNVEFVADNFAG